MRSPFASMLAVDPFGDRLRLRLEDVSSAEQGRASFDAVVCSLAFAALVVLGTRPFGLASRSPCGAPCSSSRRPSR
jgi:hypothetical protein